MNLFQSWADTVLMFILAVAYIVTYFVQRTTIKKLQTQIEAIEKTNKAAQALTEIQATNIDTYKKMVSIDEVERYSELKAKSIFLEITSGSEEFKEIVNKSADEVINQSLVSMNIEHILFLKFTFEQVLKFDKDTKTAIIKKYLPENSGLIFEVFETIDKKAETQKSLNQ